ncbi:MAG: hypothetical protein GYA55_03945, partial [SAR324 cluster bacterium]|nr:hypothetical protein [SAR324 cluster bacterium]
MSKRFESKNSDSIPFLDLHKASLAKDLIASLLILLLLIVFRYRVFANFTTHVLGGTEADAGLYIWLLQAIPESLGNLPWFSSRAFYPYGLSFAWSDNFFLPALIAWPFLKTGIAIPAIFNSIILGAAFLSGFLTYRLALMLSGNFFAALFGASVFLTDPFVAGHLGHPQLQFSFIFPLISLFYFRYMERPKMLQAFWIGLAGFLCFLCSVYYAVFASLCVFLLVAALILLRPSYFKFRHYAVLFVGATLGALPSLPFIWPYMKVAEAFGERALHEAFFFSANLASFVSAPSWSSLYGLSSAWSHPEANFFPGFIVYILAGLAFYRLFQAKTQREIYSTFGITFLILCVSFLPSLQAFSSSYLGSIALWFFILVFVCLLYAMGQLEKELGVTYFSNRALIGTFALLAVSAFVLSFGPLAYPEAGEISLSPFRLFYEIFPAFSSLRAIGRIGILLHFALIMLSVFALSHLSLKWQGFKFCILPLTLLALIENNFYTYPLQEIPARPSILSSLSDYAHKDSAVLFLPMTLEVDSKGKVKSWLDFSKKNINYMLWSIGAEYQVVNGYSGLRSKLMKELPAKTKSFPDEKALIAIKGIAGL